MAIAGDDIDPEELLKELVGSTGAWKSWSSQFLGRMEKAPGINQYHQLLATSGLRLMDLVKSYPHCRLHHHDRGLEQALTAFLAQIGCSHILRSLTMSYKETVNFRAKLC